MAAYTGIIRQPVVVGALGLCLALFLSSCSKAGSAPQEESETYAAPAPPVHEVPTEAIQAYLTMRKIELSLLRSPTSDRSVLNAVAEGPALKALNDEIDATAAAGIQITGNMTHSPAIEYAAGDGSGVTIRDCVDISRLGAVARDSRQATRLPQQLPRYTSTATMIRNSSGSWIVTDLQADRSRTC